MTEEITPARTYVVVGITLLLLTALTLGIHFIDLGPLNLVAALGIAGAKAALITWYFMNARHSSRMTLIIVFAGMLWLGLLMMGASDDYLTRGWIPIPGK